MKRSKGYWGIQILAAAVAIGSIGLWLSDGARMAWTQTSVVEMEVDEITGIEYPVRHDEFVAGVEVPVAGLAVAGVLSSVALGVSLVRGRSRKEK